MDSEAITRRKESVSALQRWVDLYNNGARTTTDFSGVNPDMEKAIRDNQAYLTSHSDPELAGLNDRLIQGRAAERGTLENLLIQSGVQVREDVSEVAKRISDGMPSTTGLGLGALGLGLVAIALLMALSRR